MKKNIYRTVIYALYSLSCSSVYTSEEQSDVLRRILDTVQHTGYSNVAPIPPFYTQSYRDAKKQLKEAEKTRERAIERGIKKMQIPEQVKKELEPEVKDLSLFQSIMYRAGVATAETEPIIEEWNKKIEKYGKEARQKIETELIQQEKKDRQEAQARIARNIGSNIRKAENYLTNSEMLQKLGFNLGLTLRKASEAIKYAPKQLRTQQEINNLADELYQKKLAGWWYTPNQKQLDALRNEALREARIKVQAMPSKKIDYTLGSSLRRAWNSAKGYFSPVDEGIKAADERTKAVMDAQKQKRLNAAETAQKQLNLKYPAFEFSKPAPPKKSFWQRFSSPAEPPQESPISHKDIFLMNPY